MHHCLVRNWLSSAYALLDIPSSSFCPKSSLFRLAILFEKNEGSIKCFTIIENGAYWNVLWVCRVVCKTVWHFKMWDLGEKIECGVYVFGGRIPVGRIVVRHSGWCALPVGFWAAHKCQIFAQNLEFTPNRGRILSQDFTGECFEAFTMSKQCAKCTKTVYPTEELKCLDKVCYVFFCRFYSRISH